ncbi:MAG: hypothetical protein LW700_13915, partial [Gemmataceae bacterium]|nr:hypothetical protein [Gemmataceae bacterium]
MASNRIKGWLTGGLPGSTFISKTGAVVSTKTRKAGGMVLGSAGLVFPELSQVTMANQISPSSRTLN